MKRNFFTLTLGIMLFTSCGDSKKSKDNQLPSFQTNSEQNVDANPDHNQFILDNLLAFDSEAELKKVYPDKTERSVRYYAEGTKKTVTTLLFPNSKNQIRFIWEDDSLSFSKLNSISLSGKDTDWKTKEGVTLGTSISELEKLNQKPFSFSGLDWDYGGRIDWQEGAISKRGISGEIQREWDVEQSKLRGLTGDKYTMENSIQSSSDLARNANFLYLGRITMRRVDHEGKKNEVTNSKNEISSFMGSSADEIDEKLSSENKLQSPYKNSLLYTIGGNHHVFLLDEENNCFTIMVYKDKKELAKTQADLDASFPNESSDNLKFWNNQVEVVINTVGQGENNIAIVYSPKI